MNIIKSTANKVLELEKRLDNQLVDKSIRVSEVSRVVESYLTETIEYPILTFNTNSELSVVVQGEVDIVTTSAVELSLTLILDGFEVYSKNLSLSAGDHSISVMKAINLVGGTSEELILRVAFTNGSEIYIKGYNFFVWGYGESLDLGVSASEPKISATEKNDNYVITFSLDGKSFVCYREAFPENLNFESFSYFGDFSYVEPIYEGEDENLSLRLFAISNNANLVAFNGEVLGVSEDEGEIIDTDVISVSATKVNESDEIVVVYARSSGEVKYFSIIDGTRSAVMTLTTMDEKIREVSLIQNCETTTFLVVGLESGRSYLFSSVTSVSWADKLSRIAFNMEVSFP